MKRFSFSLDKLLSYRLYLEKEEKMKFSVVLGEFVAISNAIEDANKGRSKILKEVMALMQGGADMSMVFYSEQARIGLRERMLFYETKKEKKASELDKARIGLMEVRKKRKALEILKDKEYAKYVLEENKEEQANLDEFASLRKTSYATKIE